MSMKRFLCPAAAALLLPAVLTSAAFASPDGSSATSRGGNPGISRFVCGELEYSEVVTGTEERTNTSRTFVALEDASVTVEAAQGGGDRCVKVVFTAEAACSPTSAGDYCYVRARDNNAVMSPNGGNFQALTSEKATAQAQAYEWVRIIGPGEHTFTLDWRVRSAPTEFFIDDWTFDVQVYDLPFGDGSSPD